MFVVGFDLEGLPENPVLDRDMRRGRPPLQARRDEEFHIIYKHALVGLEILAFEMGVDRHLCPAPSRNGWDEIQSDDTALAPSKVKNTVVE